MVQAAKKDKKSCLVEKYYGISCILLKEFDVIVRGFIASYHEYSQSAAVCI
jgi:hypothetical protein